MNIPNNQELKQNAFSHSQKNDPKDFINLYYKYTAKPYSSLVNDTSLALDSPLHFRCDLFRKDIKTNNDDRASN